MKLKINDEVYLSRKLSAADNDHFRSLSEAMNTDASKSSRIQIVSGYFGEADVLELLEQIPTKKARYRCSVTLIFGYETDTELVYGQISELKDTIEKLGYKKSNVCIKLFKDKVPLHTKLYGFLITTRPVWYIGSANLSGAIKGARHELMLRATGKSHALESYVQALLTHSAPKGTVNGNAPVGLKKFLSAGYILFRPSRHKRFTYDGFVIKPEHRKEISKRLGDDSKVPHSDPSAEGFGFDLLSAVGVKDDAQEKKHSLKIRPYCVETDYGYWVPTKYADEIYTKIDVDKMNETKKLRNICDALAKTSEEKLISEFHKYFIATQNFFEEIKINPKPKEGIHDAFRSFVKTRREWLQDKEWIKRNASKLILTQMPDIWHDEQATNVFINSLCEDICSVLNSPGKKPKIYRKISERLRLPDDPTVETIREGLASATGAFWE